MKKACLSTVALSAMLLASCGQEEIVSGSNGQNELVTVTAGVPGQSAVSRSMPEYEGTIRRCIMQVVDESGMPIEGENFRQTVEVAGETVSFSFSKPEQAYNVVFWADYVTALEKDNFYKTADLNNVQQAMTKNLMFNAPTADAFAGVLQEGTTSISLKRPFAKITIKSKDEAFKGYDQIRIGNFNVPDGYSVFTQTTTTTKAIRLDEATAMIDAENGEWTSFFMFAPVSETSTTLSLPITLSDSEGTNPEMSFTAEADVTVDANNLIDLNIKKEGEKVKVDVSFDNDYDNQPIDPSVLAVGSYVNAKGEAVVTAEEAVAVVYALGKQGDDDASSYGETFVGKTIKAYAVALQNATARVNFVGETDVVDGLIATATTYQGATTTNALLNTTDGYLKDVAEGMFTNYLGWAETNVLEGANVSGWYIPTFQQLTDITSKVFGETADAQFASKITPQSFLTNPGSDAPVASKGWYLVSSTINETLKLSTYTVGNGNNADASGSEYTCATGNAEVAYASRGFIRPVMTIFE